MGQVQTRPSGAWRWTKCSAAPLFASRAGPQPSNDAADEGTCAAWLADDMLKKGVKYARDYVGQKCPENDWPVDLEMAGHVQGYVDMVRAEGGLTSSERHVKLSPLVEGTLDNCATFLDGTIRVRDLKYGFRLIETDAEQLVIYAGSLAAELISQGASVARIVTEIYQPRGFHKDGIHRRQEWSLQEIWDRCNWIIHRAELCHQPNPPATPGPWCLECDGATGCVALHNTVSNMIVEVQSSDHREMTPAELAARLGHLRKVKAVIDAASKALEAEALSRHKTGQSIPNWGMVERFGHKKLTNSREAIRALTGIDPVKEKLMSPAELLAAGATQRQIDMVSIKPSIGFKLEPLDPRDLLKQFPQTK